MGLTSGTRLGPYEIVGPIGAGGMGEVYRARDTKLNRDVALKILPDAVATDPDRLARFRREAQVLASLNHPNIAQIHGFEDSGATHALVMELVDGRDLSTLIAGDGPPEAERPGARPRDSDSAAPRGGGAPRNFTKDGLSIDDALHIARQIADALEAAHEQGIIHRDLKPANIKVRDDGTVKVLDFGLAKALEPAGSSAPDQMNSPTLTAARGTQVGMIIGTAAYMSPEQARGKSVDRRADIWAFGVVLYEMLTGARAFKGDDVSETLASVIKETPDWSLLPPNLSPSVRRLLRRCLERDPRMRLSAISDARLELDERDDAPIAGPTTNAATAPRRIPLAGLLAAAIVGAIATAGTMWLLRPGPSADDRIARLTLLAPGMRIFSSDSGESALSPDGRWVTFVTGDQSFTGGSQLWVRAIDRLNPRLLADGESAHLPFWSPDSGRVGYFADGKLKVVSIEGGKPTVLCDAKSGRGATWSPKGVIVFAPSSGGPLMRVSENGGDPQPASTLDTARSETAHRFPWFLPDGEHFLFVALPMRDKAVQVVLGQTSSLDRKDVMVAHSAPVYAPPGYLLFLRKTELVAQGFNARTLALEGEPIPLADVPGYVAQQYTGGRAVSASSGGDVLYHTDPFPNTALEWRDLTGNLIKRVDVPPGRYGYISIAADGRRAVASRLTSSSAGDLWLLDLERGGGTRLTSTPGLNYGAVLAPNGQDIVYSGNPQGLEFLYHVAAGGSAAPEPVFRGGSQFKLPRSWSADNKLVFYREIHAETNSDIWVQPMTGDDRSPRPYLRTPFVEEAPVPSPDGKWVAYLSDEAGQLDAYVQAFPEPNAKTRVTTDGAQYIYWKKDGRQMLILGPDWRDLYLVDVDSGPPFHASRPRKVGRLPAGLYWAEAASDLSKFLVAIPEAGEAGSSLTLLQNWQAALQKIRR